MIVIVGFVVRLVGLVAVIVAFIGVLTNSRTRASVDGQQQRGPRPWTNVR